MSTPPDPITNPARLDVLRRTKLLDTENEEALDQLSRVAARLLDAPLALISLVDENRQFFKSCIGGLPAPWSRAPETPLSHSLCQYAVASGEQLVVVDARVNPITSGNKAVTDIGVIAYAGIPLIVDHQAIGTLCVVDSKPREWTDEQVETLRSLAGAVSSAISYRAVGAGVASASPASTQSSAPSLASDTDGDRILTSATRYIQALDAYDRCLTEHADEALLEAEAKYRQAIEVSEQQLELIVNEAHQDLGPPEANAAKGPAEDLLDACKIYLSERHRHHELSTAFQQGQASLEQVERQALLAREAEQSMRLAQRIYTLKQG
jgi:signal transduction protein with GAF and PtsI domain